MCEAAPTACCGCFLNMLSFLTHLSLGQSPKSRTEKNSELNAQCLHDLGTYSPVSGSSGALFHVGEGIDTH